MPSYMRYVNQRSGCGCSRCIAARNTNGPIVFDEANSILNPACGEKQRFCYQINGADSAGNVYVPMKYVIIGLGDAVTRNDICSVSVAINGVFQQVEWGVNVKLIPASSPDGVTGCTGLKLIFPLNNATDMMHVCMTMGRVFTVETVGACLNVDCQAVTGIAVPGPGHEKHNCTSTAISGIARESADECAAACPGLEVGEAVIAKCGEAIITRNHHGECGYTITQKFTVSMPVRIAAANQCEESEYCRSDTENSCACHRIGTQTSIQDLIGDSMNWHN